MASRSVLIAVVAAVLLVSLVLNAILLPSVYQHGGSNESTVTVSKTLTEFVIQPTTITQVSTSFVTTNYSPETTSIVNSTLGIKFVLSLNNTQEINYMPFESTINATLAVYSTTVGANNVTASNNWRAQNITLLCGTAPWPFGIEIFSGVYGYNNVSSAHEPLDIFPDLPCPYRPTPTSYFFANDSNPVQLSIPVFGICCRQILNPNCYCVSSTYSPFTVGRYTLVAGDEWGDLLVLQFQVMPDPGSIGASTWNPNYSISIVNTTGYLSHCCGTEIDFEVSAHNNAHNGNWALDPNGFTLVTTTNQILRAQQVAAETKPLWNLTLAPGGGAMGEVGFVLPNGTSPLSLEYNDSSSAIYTGTSQFPREVSTWVTYVMGFGVSFRNSTGANVSGITGEAYSPNLLNPGEPPFYSGETIVVNLTVLGTGQPLKVTAINVSGGFSLKSVTPTLPSSLGAGNTRFNLVLVAPNTSYTGNLDFTVTVS